MNKELVINTEEQEIKIALLEEGNLLELHQEVYNKLFSVGDIYLGIVKKILYNLNAVIIDIGHSKGGFLHYNDFEVKNQKILKLFNDSNKFYDQLYNNQMDNDQILFIKNNNLDSIESVIKIGQKILVQISKEPISNKGPKLTTKICIPGRNLILLPFYDDISISKKIKDIKERNRLNKWINLINFKNIGIIIRTAASQELEKKLIQELIFLMNKWKYVLKNMMNKKPPVRILSESNKTFCLLRDTFNNDFNAIYCDNKFICQEIYSYLSIIAPKKIHIIKYYKGNIPIFEKYGVTKQIKIFLGKNVPLKYGAYLVIEHTEALHVIDVNSGGVGIKNRKNDDNESERIDNVFKINLLAATEIVRQIILRNMGGIIIVDFIDMNDTDQKKKLYEHLKEKMKIDRAKHKILPPNKFGLVQVTRHRVRPVFLIKKN